MKLLTTNSEGRTLILKIARPGEALGLNSVITGKPYDLTAEILQPAELALTHSLMTHSRGDFCFSRTTFRGNKEARLCCNLHAAFGSALWNETFATF